MNIQRNSLGNKSRRIGLLLFIGLACLGIFLGLAASFHRSIGLYDEGFALTNAMRLSFGDVPHVDYWTAYPPGTSLVISWAFALFGQYLEVARVVNLAWSLLLLLSFFVFVLRLSNVFTGLLLTVFVSFWMSSSLYPAYSVIPALALILSSLVFLVGGILEGIGSRCLVGGFLGGCVVAFRHDFAAYLLFSLVLSIFLLPPRERVQIRSFLSAYCVVSIVLISVYLWKTDGIEFSRQAIIFPMSGMRENRYLQYPGLFELTEVFNGRWILAWFTPIFVVSLVVARLTSTKGLKRSLNLYVFGVLAIMAFLLTLQSHNRLDLPHVAPSVIFAIALLGVTLGKIDTKPMRRGYWFFGLIPILYLFYGVYVGIGQVNIVRAVECTFSPTDSICAKVGKSQRDIVEFVNSRYSSSELIFVGVARHDKIFVNDASLYFLLGRPIPTKWSEMHPGVVTTLDVQKSIVLQLQDAEVQVIVLADFPVREEGNLSSQSSGAFVLDEFISSSFSQVYEIGRYRVLERRKS